MMTPWIGAWDAWGYDMIPFTDKRMAVRKKIFCSGAAT